MAQAGLLTGRSSGRSRDNNASSEKQKFPRLLTSRKPPFTSEWNVS